ncbi:NAD-dependent epimerase/dehydratase family protein [Maribacter sp. 1_MG-2023]|uniref:NAD-dependent epimerase/dehydratase family protein n=1 Tax=Maribacter sp. 1_MG-2023 TaxID=3062677 RepID=UPI0026E166F7|nr:NAD-dependent epimerase/dehydratase family protein [Maribacter sp. 1_MG-2023]MDO6470709.1 NAD-dependent epimerase/dehydratase family protein [Maribacter sp. 1_MG-2023]
MKILVTGAAGFIGFHLVKKLVNNGHTVIGLDNINDYYDVNLKLARLTETGIKQNLIHENGELITSDIHSNYRFAKIDITDLLKLEQLFKQEKFTHVVNLAAQAGVRYSIENPHAYVQSNLVGFVNLLECCRNYKIEHFIYASSSSVYGANSKVPFSEEDRVDHPVSLYAATKKSNELMAHTYSHLYNLQTTGLRFFTVYGPWGRPDMAPILFADAISKGNPIKVFNNGDMSRDFTFIDDIIDGIEIVILQQSKKDDINLLYRILNIGNGSPQNLMDFIKEIEISLGIVAKKNYLPMQSGDVPRTWAKTTNLEDLGYKSSVEIKEGVSIFIEWFKTYQKSKINNEYY